MRMPVSGAVHGMRVEDKKRLSEEKHGEESKFTIPDPKETSSEEEYV